MINYLLIWEDGENEIGITATSDEGVAVCVFSEQELHGLNEYEIGGKKMRYTKDDFKNYQREEISNPRMPFHRCYRPLVSRANSDYYERCYLLDDGYAVRPYSYTRAFLQLQKEMDELFLYVAPADKNLQTYSYHIHELLIRVCIEIEANFKAIFAENHYSKQEKELKIYDFWKINASHRLSEYKVKMPIWEGNNNIFEPFVGWKSSTNLPWYSAYNHTKHNRDKCFSEANLKNLMDAFCGLFVVLTAQFNGCEYLTGHEIIVMGGKDSYYEGDYGIGNMLQPIFPKWADDEKYDVNWAEVCEDPDRFRKFDYDVIEDFVKVERV